ncbi:zinc finger protein 271-like [Ruditapes philippinarum]|uniref:zinc finger protein 271-like n=1 Tax=Ruditapes philippinarum TaxID=129788 RepID=UPI00295B0718|nr:zinc finger protein 271-like [Ruditapes philippinarum]
MIPAIFHGHQFHATDNACMNQANNQSNVETQNNFRQAMQFHGFQPFNITFANNNFYQHSTNQPGFQSTSMFGASDKEMKTCHISGSSNEQQCDITSAVASAIHSSTNDNETHIVSNKTFDISASYPQNVPEQTQIPSQQQLNPSPLGELRLPTIKTSSNVAANVMSEESDLGYCSFSDMSTFQDISDAMVYSEGPNDQFDDVKTNFSDLIDDVLDSIDKRDLIKTECVTPENCENVDFTESQLFEVHQNVYEQKAVHHSPTPMMNYFEPLNIQTTPTFQGFVPCVITSSAYPVVDMNRYNTDLYCQECDKSFQTKSSLRVHMRQHRGERPHQCPYCQKSFAQKSTLRTHVRTHTGERPYTCNFCSRAFGDYSTYRKHVRVHTGEKPYTCDVCNKSFTQSGNMIRHKEVHLKKSQKKSLVK